MTNQNVLRLVIADGLTKRTRQPSKAARRKVRDAFDGEKLAALCTETDFSGYAQRIDLRPERNGCERFYYYQDNGSDVLAVAHLDSVQQNGACTVVDTAAGPLVVSGALDDRLGVYVILELLPKLGITCDWLLTTNEEIGQSTAGFFETEKTYKWMFQFDRGGTDVVMYDYETWHLVDLVEEAGARVGMGSYSDICRLEHLGCSGFNWGVGYQDYHSSRSHAWLNDTFRMVARFVKFYEANHTRYLPYDDGYGVGWRDTLVAECGHEIDLAEPKSYVESEGGSLIVCAACATAA